MQSDFGPLREFCKLHVAPYHPETSFVDFDSENDSVFGFPFSVCQTVWMSCITKECD